MLSRSVCISFPLILLFTVGIVTHCAELPIDPIPVEESKLQESTAENNVNSDQDQGLSVKFQEKNQIIPSPNGDGSFANTDKIINFSDLTDDLETWEAPLYLQKAFPYYHSGFDDEGRPVWIAEGGKYPVQYLKLIDQVDEAILEADIGMYLKKASYQITKSIHAQNSTNREVTDAFFVFDCDGVAVRDIAHPKVLATVIKVFREYRELIIHNLGACIVINMNYVAQLVLSLLRPVLGRAMEKIEIYGTNPAKWKAAFRKRLPMKAIPAWYGGSPDFTPIKVYG